MLTAFNWRVCGYWVSLVVAAASLILDSGQTAWAAEPQKQVLVLYSTRRDAQIVVVGDHEIPRILTNGLPEGVDYYSEFIDRARFVSIDYQDAFRDFLVLKYRDHQFDLVIAMDDIALQFVNEYRNDMFAAAPLVFFGNEMVSPRPPDSTGLIAPLDLKDTLELVSELQPGTRNVFVVSGADEGDQKYDQEARTQLQPFETRFAITYLSGLPSTALEKRLASLPSSSVIYYLIVARDGDGENVNPLEYLDRITSIANAPVYSWVDSTLDHGIVGGSLKRQQTEAAALADLGVRILKGERADSIPVTSRSLNVREVDWRQLRRWGISESRVPVGTIVSFREPSAWSRYRAYIVGALMALLAQMILIAGLLVQRAHRRRIEQQMIGSEAALRTSYERIRDLGTRLMNAQETERSRIARELHDDICQRMAVLEMDLGLLGRVARGNTRRLAGEALNIAQDVARSVHDLSHRLHPTKLRLIGLTSALEDLQRELSRSSDIAIRFTHDHVPSDLSSDLMLSIFRIVQEALHNAVKHSQADGVIVNLSGRSGILALSIADDGVGFEPAVAWGKGLGLLSIRERVEALGGTFVLDSKPGAGTRIEVTTPFSIAQAAETLRLAPPGSASA